jgi:hypothetical protein
VGEEQVLERRQVGAVAGGTVSRNNVVVSVFGLNCKS